MPSPIILTVSGMLESMRPARNRPGCILTMQSGNTKGDYYVPLSPHDCRQAFPEGRNVSFRIFSDAKQHPDGSYETAGPVDRLWNVTSAR